MTPTPSPANANTSEKYRIFFPDTIWSLPEILENFPVKGTDAIAGLVIFFSLTRRIGMVEIATIVAMKKYV